MVFFYERGYYFHPPNVHYRLGKKKKMKGGRELFGHTYKLFKMIIRMMNLLYLHIIFLK